MSHRQTEEFDQGHAANKSKKHVTQKRALQNVHVFMCLSVLGDVHHIHTMANLGVRGEHLRVRSLLYHVSVRD